MDGYAIRQAPAEVRVARLEDTAEMLAIYRHHVEETAVTFDVAEELPDAEGFAAKMRRTMERYPWLAAVEGSSVVGYAYAGAFRDRAAYDWSAEVTVYLAPDARGKGTGRALYRRLEELLALQGVRTLFACVPTTPRAGDSHLTDASPRFHERMGYDVERQISSTVFP